MNFSEFDWIQWYMFVLIIISIIASISMDGDLKSEPRHRLKFDVITWFLAMPIWGRVLGLW